MFYPVTIKDKFGNIKKKYSTSQLSKRHWASFKLNRPMFTLDDKHITSMKRKKSKTNEFYDFVEYDYNFYLP